MGPCLAEQKVIDDLRREGISVVQLGDLLPTAMFEDAREWAERLLEDESLKEWIERARAGERMITPDSKSYLIRPLGHPPVFDTNDVVMRICLSDPVLRIVSAYFGMFPRLNAADLWYNVPVSGPPVFSQRWHRDPEDRWLVKTFLYLRDVDKDTGPLCYIPRSHNRGIYGHLHSQKIYGDNYPADGTAERLFERERWQECEGKAGTLIFCDTSGFHRGGLAKSKARMLFNSVYTSNACPWNSWDRFRLRKSPQRHLGPVARYATDHVRPA
jgi:hypothetical protein